MKEIMVTVKCTTYNHVRYIRQCLESLVSQKTDFRYEIVVHDDASTDGTQEIIREYEKKYPSLIVPIYEQENQFSKGSLQKKLYPYIRGKYTAVCEGDDFWTDNNKLQKQIDFLENHPDFVICGHAAYYANEDGSLKKKRFFNYGDGNREIKMSDVIGKWMMATNSMVYLTSVLDDNPIPYKGNAYNGDWALMSYCLLKGRGYYIDELMSAYRVQSFNSITWKSRNNLQKRIESISRFSDMLRRFDVYTHGAYHIEIIEKIRMNDFTLCLIKFDIDGAKKQRDLYNAQSVASKAKLYLGHYFPWLVSFGKKIHTKVINMKFHNYRNN